MSFIKGFLRVWPAMYNQIDPEFIKWSFPTLSEMTYLNNASTGIPPKRTVDAMTKYLDNRVHARGDFEETLTTFSKLRENLARLLGGKKENYAFIPSTSEGINTAAQGIDYPQNSNIVLCDLEFPSNYIPWQNVANQYGVELRVAKSEDGSVDIGDFVELIDEMTRVVAVSHVQFGSGFRTDLKALAEAVHEVDGLLVADIIQSAGWAQIDLKKWKVDFAAAQAAKWLIGPIGAGFIYVSNEALEKIKPRYMGWWGVENVADFSFFERTPFSDARKYQTGSPPMIGYVGFLASLETLLEISNEKRESAAMSNADYLRTRLSEENIDFYEFEKENRSPIVSCVPDDVEDLMKKLQDEKIHCSIRNGRLRVSPHFYNNHEEIDRLMSWMG